MEFSFSWYQSLLEKIKAEGYVFASYHNHTVYEKACILRHDIDLSIDKMIELARIENKIMGSNDTKSTIFVLLNSNFYNVFSRESRSMLSLLQSLGHEIGLHFDETAYGKMLNSDELRARVCAEASILEKAIDSDVRVVSMHRPSKETLSADFQFDHRVNSYGKLFFNDFKYLSDSRMRWREDVDSVVSSGKFNKLQIVVHPIWYSEVERSIDSILLSFINEARHQRYVELSENITSLGDILSEEDISDDRS